LSVDKLARSKAYELVAVTQTNAIFVDSQYFALCNISDNSLEKMRPDESKVTYIFNGFDGTVFIRGSGKLAWHGIPYRESKLQQVPRWLRQYPKNYKVPRWLRQYPKNYNRFKKSVAKLYRSLVKRNIL
jgi:hypothetical protein